MSKGPSFFSAVLMELNRRKVLRTVGGYAVTVFVVLQLMDADSIPDAARKQAARVAESADDDERLADA